MKDIAFSTVAELSTAIRDRKVSPVEILDDTLQRLCKIEPELNMFACLDEANARVGAKASEARQMQGALLSPLDGIPTSVKDLIAQKGLPQRFGSRATPTDPVPDDAPSVARLRAAGAVLLGKSTTSEFGCKGVGDSPLTGITRNPWDKTKTPGGSSCGAAAMVASGLVPYAIGTDGGGSLRIPASMCGLFGMKAQFGRVPVFPVSATPTLAHDGPLTRNVDDAASVLGVISGHDRRDPFSVAGPVPDYIAAAKKSRKMKIAYSPTMGFARPDAEVVEIVGAAVAQLKELDHTVVELPYVMDDPVEMWTAEFYAGVGSKLKDVIETQPDLLDPAVLEVLQKAVAQDMGDYYATVFQRYAFREKLRAFFEEYDAFVTPTLPSTAIDVGKDMPDFLSDRTIVSWVFYTYAFNLTGQPAASVPAGFAANGLPVGMQIVGAINDEEAVFTLSAEFERQVGGFASLAKRII